MDYLALKTDGTWLDPGETVEDDNVFGRALVFGDSGNGALTCIPVDKKGATDSFGNENYAVGALTQWLDRFGYKAIEIRADGEPALGQLVKALKSKWAEKVVLQQSPSRSPQSLGGAENGQESQGTDDKDAQCHRREARCRIGSQHASMGMALKACWLPDHDVVSQGQWQDGL